MGERMGFVYSLWSGRFICKQGKLVQLGDLEDHLAYIYFDGKRLLVNNSPFVVYNAMVWLEERNDTLAASLLIDHERNQIKQLQEKIGNHQNKIDILYKGMMEKET